MGAELDRDAVQRLEGVAQQQQLALGVGAGPLREAAFQVEPISTLRWVASTFMKVVIPITAPVSRRTVVKGSIRPAACSASRRSISAAIPSGRGTAV